MADEYDAAQDRGEIVGPKGGGDSTVPVRNAATAAEIGLSRKGGRPKTVPDENGFTAKEAGLDRKEIHDARQIRDVIAANPAAVRDALDDILERGDEPTRAAQVLLR